MSLALLDTADQTSATTFNVLYSSGQLNRLASISSNTSSMGSKNESGPLKKAVSIQRSLQFDLFEATRVAKTWTASVASRLDDSTRLWLFRQLNRLHDADEWLDGDRPVDLDSYKSFVRALIVGYIGGRPAIALGNRGEIIAIWQDNQDRLIVDFYADGKVRFLVNQLADEQRERVAGNTITARLKQVLNPYRHERWFQHGR